MLRLVIDISRHSNKYMIVPHTKLQNLNTLELWVTQNIFQTSLDLTSIFHHVKLHESMYEFFGFEYELGMSFFGYELPFAMYCVRKLLNPICTYRHSLSILFSIYIDDIRIMNQNYEVCITPNFVSKSERVQDGIRRIVERGAAPLCPPRARGRLQFIKQ